MATMNISLPKEMVDFVEREFVAGGYTSSSEVVREALRLLQHDKELEREKLVILRREVAIGLEAAEAGRFSKRPAECRMEGLEPSFCACCTKAWGHVTG